MRILAGLVVTIFVGASAVNAAPILAGQYVQLSDFPGNTGGGEFQISQTTSTGTPLNFTAAFISFCIQRTEYIDFQHVFYVEGVNDYAYSDPQSNGGGSNGKDYLDPRTAYLYTTFRSGQLPGYDYSTLSSHAAAHQSGANELQIAFWMIEEEVKLNDGTGLYNANNVYYTMATNAVNNHLWSGIGNVRALNLRYESATGTEAQDQLTLVTPEPASLLLLGSGLSFAAARLRRQKKTSSAASRS